jgi:hypothetical protein
MNQDLACHLRPRHPVGRIHPTFLCYLAALLAALAACSRPPPADGPGAASSTVVSMPRAPTAIASPSSTRGPLPDQLIGSLSGFEHVPDRAELARLGRAAELTSTLTAMYRDPSLPSFVRIRALTSLRFFPGAQSKTVLEQALTDPVTSDQARRAAVKAYGAGFGAQAIPLLDRLLVHHELHTRNAAAHSLVDMKEDAAREALRRRLPDEPEPLIRKTIETGMRR